MRKTIISLAGIFFILNMAGLASAADKLAYVDLSRLFSEYKKTADYDKVLTEKEGAYNTERETRVGDIKQMQDKMNLLSDKEKQEKKAELESKIKVLQDFDRQKTTDLRKDQDEKMKEILKDIEAAVKQYAEKEGYTIVFNDRVLVYQTKNMDITDKVVEILNKGYKK